LLKAILDTGKSVVLVLFNGSPLTVQWAHEKVDAIIEAWYPGEKGGEALADVLFGDYNPAGRLPITYVQSVEQLPPFTDYSMAGRTYRYLTKEPLYPFGYGLSYTDFSYSNLRLDSSAVSETGLLEVEVEVKNSGAFAGDEVVQLYIKHLESEYAVPNWQLQGVKRVQLAPEEKTTVCFSLMGKNLSVVTENGERIVPAGPIEIFVGGQQPDKRSTALTGKQVLKASFTIG